jgi:chaperonin GroEL
MALARIAQMLPEGIVSKALRRPALQILENAGYGETELTKALTTSAGFNSLTGKYGDLIEMGVIDPAKVIKSSLRNAASVACQMLLTELITQTVEK